MPSPVITFEVDLSLRKKEVNGPGTNPITTTPFHPREMATIISNLPSQISCHLPTLFPGTHLDKKNAVQFTVEGQEAIYLRDTYGVGYVADEFAWLKIISIA